MHLKLRISLVLLTCLLTTVGYGQYEIIPADGYTLQIGTMVAMLEDLKGRITDQVKDLSIEETDYHFDDKANSIGAIIMHLIATESYYQVETLEIRPWSADEMKTWGAAGMVRPL